MNCNPELVSAFLDRELETIILNEVLSHLLECESCCKILSQLVQVRDLISGKQILPDPEKTAMSVMSAICNDSGSHPIDQ